MDTNLEGWWSVYGNFREGVGCLPHFGDIISTRCRLLGYTTKNFAQEYGCTVRYAQMLGSDSNVNNPKDPEKRKLLATILKVTPLLFGLPATSEEGNRAVIDFISQQHMLAYEDVLSMSWQLYYTGDFQVATRNLSLWLYLLENGVSESTGVGKDQLLSFQSKFLQLSATSLRDKGAVNAALKDSTKALKIARELGNPELIVSGLHHRHRVFIRREEYEKSQADIHEALAIIDKIRVPDALRGNIYVDAGEIYSSLAVRDKSLQQRALKYFDKASSLARSLPDTGSNDYLRFSISRVMNERAANVATFGMKREAIDSLHIAQNNLTADNIRWRIENLLSQAEIQAYVDEDVSGCYLSMLEAMTLHDTTNSKSKDMWMKGLYRKCQGIELNNKYTTLIEQKLQIL